MFWYSTLTILTGVFIVVAIASLVFAMADCPGMFIACLVAVAIAVAANYGVEAIEEKNTTITTEVVAMEVTKLDITSTGDNGYVRKICYVTVSDEYIVEVNPEQYVKLNIGDIVDVEIVVKTVFGEKSKPIITLVT